MVTSLSPLCISIQNTPAKPNNAYGQLAQIPMSTTQAMLARVGLPAAVSDDAVIASAILTFVQGPAVSGSVTVNLRKAAGAFKVNQTTWNNAAAATGATVAVTKSSPAAGTLWQFDVTSDLQGYTVGSLVNYGWRIAATAAIKFKGSVASSGQPALALDFVEPGEAPADLAPNGGVVSLAKPVLTFLVAPDTTAVQVQVDADATGGVDFDSGEIASSVGQVDLSATAYAGLSSGSSTFWRARSRGGTGLTAWSPWASFSRTTKPTVTITSPSGSTTDDITPPIQWSVSGGTQESWRVIVYNAAGDIKLDSGRVASAATTWTPTTPVTRTEGATVTVEVRVWDNVDRVTTPGDPEYGVASKTLTLSTHAITAPSTVAATTDSVSPAVSVAATAASAPDGWALIRDGERIYTNESLATTSFNYTDWTATPNHAHTYRAARIVNGEVSSGGPTATVTPRCQGLWLVDPDDGTAVVMLGTDEGSWSAVELAVIHQPIAGPPIRRVAYRPPLSGSQAGELLDVPGGQTADTSIANLYVFKSSAANRLLRFVAGDRSIPVNVGDITVSPTPISGTERWSRVSFAWWQVDDVPWTA